MSGIGWSAELDWIHWPSSRQRKANPMTHEQIAQQLYEAYCRQTDWKSAISGEALPQWDCVRAHVRAGWMNVADQAERIYACASGFPSWKAA